MLSLRGHRRWTSAAEKTQLEAVRVGLADIRVWQKQRAKKAKEGSAWMLSVLRSSQPDEEEEELEKPASVKAAKKSPLLTMAGLKIPIPIVEVSQCCPIDGSLTACRLYPAPLPPLPPNVHHPISHSPPQNPTIPSLILNPTNTKATNAATQPHPPHVNQNAVAAA